MSKMKTGAKFMPKVANAIFEVNDMIAFIAKANTDASVTITNERTDVTAGQNNAIIGTLFSNSKVEVSFTSAEWKPEFLAAQIGQTIKVGSFSFISDNLQLPVEDNGSGKSIITLPALPSNGKIYIENNGGYITVSAASTEVDVTSLGYQAGDCLVVIGMFPQDGKRIAIGVEQTPLVGKLTLSSPIFEGTKGKIGESQYVFETFQFDGNFTQQYSSDSKYEMKGMAIASTSDLCGEGDVYGSYNEYLFDSEDLYAYSGILAMPSILEVPSGDTGVITVYGYKNELYDKAVITPDAGKELKFSVETGGAAVASVDQSGVVTGLGAGTTKVNVSYQNKLFAAVTVDIY